MRSDRFGVACIWGVFVLSLGLFACGQGDVKSELETVKVISGGTDHAFQVEIADDDAEREKGLMYRDAMADDHGMLFLFPDARERAFWMKNTHIPLDIIYISQSGSVISIQKNAVPMTQTPLKSYGAAAAVLEVNGGLTDRLGIRAGDRISHPFFEGKGPASK